MAPVATVIPTIPAPATPVPVTTAPVSVVLPPLPGFPSCNVYDANDPTVRVTNPDGIVEVAGQHPTLCFSFQRTGDNGFVEATLSTNVTAFLERPAKSRNVPSVWLAMSGRLFSRRVRI